MIGRGGKTGIATTLIIPNQSEVVLKDLKHLLVEAKQKVPEFLNSATENLQEEDKELVALTGVRGCAYCGGLGHRIGNTLLINSRLIFTIMKQELVQSWTLSTQKLQRRKTLSSGVQNVMEENCDLE